MNALYLPELTPAKWNVQTPKQIKLAYTIYSSRLVSLQAEFPEHHEYLKHLQWTAVFNLRTALNENVDWCRHIMAILNLLVLFPSWIQVTSSVGFRYLRAIDTGTFVHREENVKNSRCTLWRWKRNKHNRSERIPIWDGRTSTAALRIAECDEKGTLCVGHNWGTQSLEHINTGPGPPDCGRSDLLRYTVVLNGLCLPTTMKIIVLKGRKGKKKVSACTDLLFRRLAKCRPA